MTTKEGKQASNETQKKDHRERHAGCFVAHNQAGCSLCVLFFSSRSRPTIFYCIMLIKKQNNQQVNTASQE
jgi:hypothetical protein